LENLEKSGAIAGVFRYLGLLQEDLEDVAAVYMREAGERIYKAIYPHMHHLMWEHSPCCQVLEVSYRQWDGH